MIYRRIFENILWPCQGRKMKNIFFYIIGSLVLCGCANINTNKINQNKISRDQINSSVNRQMKAAGLFLVEKLRMNDFAGAFGLLKEARKSLNGAIQNENRLFLELNSLHDTKDDLSPQVHELVRLYPDETMSYIARGFYFLGKSLQARGGKWSSETSDQQRAMMLSIQSSAIKDFEKSIDMNPGDYIPYLMLAEVYIWSASTNTKAQEYYKAALEKKPESFWVWANMLHKSTPRWGGSYEQMQQKIDSMKKYIAKNEKLSVLQNYIVFDQADMAEIDGQYVVAKSLYEEALKYGLEYKALVGLGYIQKLQGDYGAGCGHIREAVKLRPYAERANINLIECETKGF
jgi:tetratricopeptide (TPR) repeat protein